MRWLRVVLVRRCRRQLPPLALFLRYRLALFATTATPHRRRWLKPVLFLLLLALIHLPLACIDPNDACLRLRPAHVSLARLTQDAA